MKENVFEKRKAEIELLRIISMIMIITLHYFNQGKILETLESGYNYYIVWILEGICFVSVNAYIFITGFFSWKIFFKWKKVVSFYVEILFYTIVISIIAFGCKIEPMNLKNIVGLLPIVSRKNWFVTVYFASLFLFPLLNTAIGHLPQKTLKSLLIILIALFSVIPTIFFYTDQFNINSGYSILWYIIVYLTAAYIGKYNIRYSNKKCIIFLSFSLILPISKFLLEKMTDKLSILENYNTTLYKYNSVPVFIASLGLFMLFLNIHISNRFLVRFILKLGKSTFGVFYIHSFFLIRNHIWVFLGSLKYVNSILFIPYSFAVILLCYFFFSLIDFIRIKLFSTNIFTNICSRITDLFEKIFYISE